MQLARSGFAVGSSDPVLPAPRAVQGGSQRSVMFLNDLALSRRNSDVLHRMMARMVSPAALIGGVDALLGDPALALRARTSRAFVMVLPPLGNLTNGFYAVHPRRNDRFVAARAPLKALYPEIDFAGFAFTGELLCTLAATCPVRFLEMRKDIARQWLARLEQVLAVLPSQGIILEPPAAPWLTRPALPYERGMRRVLVDPDNRAASVTALLQTTRQMA